MFKYENDFAFIDEGKLFEKKIELLRVSFVFIMLSYSSICITSKTFKIVNLYNMHQKTIIK